MKSESWRVALLPEAYWFQEGPGIRNTQFTTSGIKLLNVANIDKNGSLQLAKTSRYLSAAEVRQKYTHFLVDDGDLLIASSGISFDRDGLLRTRGVFARESHLPLVMNTSTIRLKAKDGLSDLNFFRHWLQSLEFRRQITQLVTGSAQQNFGPSHLKQINIALPSIDEQRRIAAILDQAEALRAKRREALAKLDTLTQSLFLEMFGDPFSLARTSIAAPLKDVVNGVFDCPHSTPEWTEAGIRCLRTPDLGIGHWVTGNERYVSETTYLERSRRAELSAGDIVLSREGTVGIAAIVEKGFRACMGQRLVHIKPNMNKAVSEYLLWYLLQILSPERISRFMVGSTAQHLNVKELRALPIPLPPMEQQVRFKRTLQTLISEKQKAIASSERISVINEYLQHCAFRGEL